jgi:hypothetical protein
MTKRRMAIGLGVVVLLTGGGLAGAAIYASRQADRQAQLVLAQLPPGVHAKHGAASYSLLGNRLMVEDVAFEVRTPWLRDMHVARMTVEGLNHSLWDRLLGNAGFSAAAIILDTIDYDIEGGFHQSIERATLTAPRLDHAAGTPVQEWSLAQWLAAFSLASAEASNLHSAGADPATGAKLEFRVASRRLSGITAGRLAAEVDEKIVGDLDLDQVVKLHVELAEARVDDVDLLGLDKIFDPANYGEADAASWVRDPAFYTLLGTLTLSGLTVSVDAAAVPLTISLDRLSLGGMKMRQWPFPPTTPPPNPSAEAALDLLQSVSLDSIELKQLAMTPQSPILPFSFALGELVVKTGPGRLEHGEIDALAINGPGMKLTLGALQLDGLVIRLPEGFRFDPLGWAINPPGLPHAFVERFRLADVSIRYPLLGEHSLKELSASMAGTIDAPTRVTLDMTQLAVDFGALVAVPLFNKFGYGKVNFDSHGEAIYDTGSKSVAFKSTFGAPEMGQLSLAYRLDNYPKDWATGSAEAMEKIVMGIAIEGGELRYDDASLVDHILTLVADETGATAAATRQSAFDMLAEQKASYADDPLVQDALDAVIEFLRAPKSIRVVVKPPSPVTIGELYRLGEPEPNDLMELLGLKVDRP